MTDKTSSASAGASLVPLGVLVTIGGWAFLLLGASSDTGRYGAEVFNLHSGVIAQCAIYGGYALMIMGAVYSAGDKIVSELGASKRAAESEEASAAFQKRMAGFTAAKTEETLWR